MNNKKTLLSGSAYPMRLRKFFSVSMIGIMVIALGACAIRQDLQQRNRQGEVAPPLVFATSIDDPGMALTIHFEAGKSFNHPLMAIWIEDLDSNYIQTIYIARSIAEGIFRHGDATSGRWMPGPIRRPAALPYWGHQRGIQASDGLFLPTTDSPMPDAITGATPKGNFVLNTHAPADLTKPFRILLEINQSWDWNQHWTNNKFPEDESYRTSAQPAVVYETIIDPASGQTEFDMQPIGHSHWSGKTGDLYNELGTLTTALDIAGKIKVELK